MFKNKKYFALNELSEFQDHETGGVTHTTNSELAYGQYKWNDVTQSIEARNGASSGTGYFYIPVGKLYSGDIVRIELETRWLAGNPLQMALDRSYNADYSGSKFNMFQTTYDRPDTTEFITRSVSYVIRQDGYYRIGIGTWNNQISRYELRRAKVLVYTDSN